MLSHYCNKCDGFGSINNSKYNWVISFVKCNECDGTGVVPPCNHDDLEKASQDDYFCTTTYFCNKCGVSITTDGSSCRWIDKEEEIKKSE